MVPRDAAGKQQLYAQERLALDRLAQGDETAREDLITLRLGFAQYLGRTYIRDDHHPQREDLVAEATAALVEAVMTFDPASARADVARHYGYTIDRAIRGRLRTYVGKYCRYGGPGVSAETSRWIWETVKTRDRLRETLDREPTVEEIAAEAPVPSNSPETIAAYLRKESEVTEPVEPDAHAYRQTPVDVLLHAEGDEARALVIEKVLRGGVDPKERDFIQRSFGLGGRRRVGGGIAPTVRKAVARVGRLLRIASAR